MPGLATLLLKDQTGVDMPPVLADMAKGLDADKIKSLQADVTKAFQDALDNYTNPSSGGTDSGPAAKSRSLAAQVGTVEANKKWAQYCLMIGDATGAKEHLDAADSQQKLIDSGQAPAAPDDTSSTPAVPTTDTSTDSTAATQPATDPSAAPAATPDATPAAAPMQ